MKHLLRLLPTQNSLPILKSDGNKPLFYEWFVAILADYYKVNHFLIFGMYQTPGDVHLRFTAMFLQYDSQYRYILTWYSRYASILCRFLQAIVTIIRFRRPIQQSICFLVYKMP